MITLEDTDIVNSKKGETMKTLFLVLALLSTSAFASMNDFECEFSGVNGEQVKVEIERSRGPGTKRINVSVIARGDNGDLNIEDYQYYTSARMGAMNRIEYWGSGMDLEIDLWPDRRPRFGRMYRSEFRSFDVNNGRTFYNIYCQYTGF